MNKHHKPKDAAEVSVRDAKAKLSELLVRVEAGEEITITRHGKPVAKLNAVELPYRRPGTMKGKIWVSDDFDEPLQDMFDSIDKPVDAEC